MGVNLRRIMQKKREPGVSEKKGEMRRKKRARGCGWYRVRDGAVIHVTCL